MMRWVHDLRVIPIALLASACLLVLKTADLLLDRDDLFRASNAPAVADTSVIRSTADVPQASRGKQSWAQEMFNFPDANRSPPASALPSIARAPGEKASSDITGSITPPARQSHDGNASDADNESVGAIGKEQEGKDGKSPKDAKPTNSTVIPTEGPPLPSGAERAILERLQERRQELDSRARELDIRESLIKSAEKRMEARLAELKEVEARISVATDQKDEAEAARFKGLVTMYENMKPRDAAKIFDRLEIGVLLAVASQINPRRMSDILAQMSPEAAERLTIELASRARKAKNNAAELPKIEGRPTAP